MPWHLSLCCVGTAHYNTGGLISIFIQVLFDCMKLEYYIMWFASNIMQSWVLFLDIDCLESECCIMWLALNTMQSFFFTFLTYLLNFIPQSCNRRFSTHLSLGFFLRISFWGRVIAFTLDAIDTMSFLISPKILLSFNENTHFYSICHDFHFLSKFCNNWCILWAKGKYLIFVK